MTSRSRTGKLRSVQDAISYFNTHQRIKIIDLQQSKSVHTLAWNCDGTKIACGAEDRKVSIGSVDSACRVKVDSVSAPHDASVEQIAFQHTNPFIFASASMDKSICIWDVRQTRTQTKLSTRAPNMFLAWSPCGKQLVYGDRENKIHIVDGRTLSIMKTQEFKAETNEIAIHPCGKYAFVASGNGRIEILSMTDLQQVKTIQALSTQTVCLSIAISKDGTRMAVGGNDALCTLWNIDQFVCESTIARLDYPVRTVGFNYADNLIAAGSEDRMIDIAWAEDGEKVSDVRIDGETFSVAWHPKQNLLAYSGKFSENSRERESSFIRLFGFSS